MRSSIAKLRKTLPEFFTVLKYCEIKGCCKATAYNDLRRVPGLGVKIGWNTFIARDVMLAEMAKAERPQAWTPAKERGGNPGGPTSNLIGAIRQGQFCHSSSGPSPHQRPAAGQLDALDRALNVATVGLLIAVALSTRYRSPLGWLRPPGFSPAQRAVAQRLSALALHSGPAGPATSACGVS
jgi:hypothetical protein